MGKHTKELRGWSYSAWASLMSCPYRFERGYLMGVKGKSSWFVERGIQIHKIAEQYLKGAVTVLPKALKFFRPHYAELKKMNPVVEQFWGIDERFRLFEPDFKKGERSWCVMKMDAAVPPTKRDPILMIQDLKTGRIYDNHVKQAGLYATIGMAKYPKLEGADVEFWYADQKDTRVFSYTRERLKELVELWTERGRDVMTIRKKYKATPSKEACAYCFLKTSEGGPCNRWREVMDEKR